MTDHNGVVILTSRPEWRFRSTRPLSDAEREAITAIQPYPTRDPKPLNLDANAWLTQTRQIEETGWSVSILAPRTLIDRPVRTVVAIGGATLLVLMLLLGLMMQRRRHYLERIAFEAKARHELEGRVAERTSDLEGLNRRLKQEVLEREHAQQELVRAQDDLVQAGKLSALGTMSASISHELNQPLAAIRSYAEKRRSAARSSAHRGCSRQPQADQRIDRAHGLDHRPPARLRQGVIATPRKAWPCNRHWTTRWRYWPSVGAAWRSS